MDFMWSRDSASLDWDWYRDTYFKINYSDSNSNRRALDKLRIMKQKNNESFVSRWGSLGAFKVHYRCVLGGVDNQRGLDDSNLLGVLRVCWQGRPITLCEGHSGASHAR
jgi:hypothetical protein